MRRLPFDGLLPVLLAGLALALLPPATRGQGEPEKVGFETVDEVELKGTFYPSDQATKAPCVLLLHNVGGTQLGDGLQLGEDGRQVRRALRDARRRSVGLTVSEREHRARASLRRTPACVLPSCTIEDG